jgi:WD40 repeat protein
MMKSYHQSRKSDLPIAENSYIYSISSTAARNNPGLDSCNPLSPSDKLVVLSSDNSLLVLNPESLEVIPDGRIKDISTSVTNLKHYSDNVMLVSGRDGIVTGWDIRLASKVLSFEAPSAANNPLSMIDCSPNSHLLAAGTESEREGPGDVSIFIWDIRNPKSVRTSYIESHTDTITELRFLPYPSVLLSASTDGLVNVFDTTKPDEDEAVIQVINHRSAVHHAGLIGSDIYALGTDETLSFHCQQSSEIENNEPEPFFLGDVRGELHCDYAIKLHNDIVPIIAVGSHSNQQNIKLVPMQQEREPKWIVKTDNSIHLIGGHGEEVVRDVYIDAEFKIIFTCGEDGVVKQWRESEDPDIEMGGTVSGKRKHTENIEKMDKIDKKKRNER